MEPEAAVGARLAPHTADMILEAWGPDRLACLRAAAEGLIRSFAKVTDAPVTRVVPLSVDSANGAEQLVGLLEELLFTIEVFGVVPVRVHVEETDGGGLAGDMEVVDAATASLVGSVPKGVSYHDLEFGPRDGGWHCRVVVDV